MFADGAVQTALAQFGRHQLVDDPVVEGVARYADARARQRRRTQAVGRMFEPDDGEVAGAAAEVGDQDRGVRLQLACEIEGGANRLVRIADVGEAQPLERRLIARQGQGLVRIAARKGDGTADDDGGRGIRQGVAGMVAQALVEGGQQILEGVAFVVDPGFGKGGAGGEGLERLDEAGLQRILDIGGDGPGPGLDHTLGRLAVHARMGLEAERRAEGGRLALDRVEGDEMGEAVGIGQGDDRIGRAEIDPDRHRFRRRHGMAPG